VCLIPIFHSLRPDPPCGRFACYCRGLFSGVGAMSERRRDWWRRSEVLAQIAMALLAALAAGYLARLLMHFAQAH
jgi:hypothetical protein